MSNPDRQLSQSHDIAGKVAQMLQTRTRLELLGTPPFLEEAA